jgi:hypothetical protein
MGKRSRLFHSIVVVGASLGAGTAVVATAATLISGCIEEHGKHAWPIIDASLPFDAPRCDAGCWPMIDASIPIDSPHADGHT